uniref:alpha-ketoglutarate-dependent dioxygenase AlkB-like n=1 Tax=Erigeron canadensis TaxID=72917 RepID=UPI001CB89D7A|nr:alpha-ketoglutarate-dependent dioxygenase AlkB-like [Erigeron canadensis]
MYGNNNNRQSNWSSSSSSAAAAKFKQTTANWKPRPKIVIDGPLDSASSSQKDNNASLVEEPLVESEALGVKDLKTTVKSLDDNNDCISKTGKQVSDKSSMDDGEDGSSRKPFDICHKKVHSGVKLKKSLLAINKEKRNQKNRGKSIDLLRSGMVLLKNYISIEDQISIIKTCRDLGVGAGGFYQPGYQGGTKLHLKMMCLGKNWDPERKLYSDTRPFDDAKPPEIPDLFHDMVKKAIQDSNAHIKSVNPTAYGREIIRSMSPDLCIVNFYSRSGKLGLHQDKDESENSLKKGLPVVSFSIGDSAEFLYGDTRDIDKVDKVILESGDVLIFGGKSRHIFHGVSSIHPDTVPSSLQETTDMVPGRLNLTFRQY